ncbi:MAG TPA: formate dehydrogenase subunit gamma [Thermoanaerobaculia bacterium]|jgi:formate dehydrogenase subunit gamma|nr:formate dehydrogenase subunit gamma [Thermoanaerobaculia bacterium]
MSERLLLPNGRVLRYSFNERLMHWVAGFSYIYLLLTGLAFWSPWLFWIAVVLGGGTISRILHPWAGVIFFFAVLWMYAKWGAQMRSTERDREWWRALPHYIRNEDEEVPSEGRFNAGQKSLFWGFLWCGVVLFLTGLVLWVPHWISWDLRWLRLISVILHPIAALLTIALFMIHVYMGTAVERGAFGSVVRGDVSRKWAARYHRSWYDQVVRDAGADE